MLKTNSLRLAKKDVNPLSKVLLGAGFCLALTACGGGDELNSLTAPVDEGSSAASLSGSAIKGAIVDGVVKAYLVEERNGKLTKGIEPAAPFVRTDANGEYQLTIDGELINQNVIVEITADSQTKMTCDVTTGCTSHDGSAVDFGEQFALSNEFVMRGMATGVSAGEAFSVHVNPISHMAVAHAESQSEGLSAASIRSSFAHVENLFDLDAGATSLAPVNITKLESYSNISKLELEMGVLSASFLALVNAQQWGSIVDVLDHIENVIASDGSLVSQSAVDDAAIGLDEVFSHSLAIANDLIAALPDSKHAETFVAVSQEATASYDAVSDDSSSETPLSISTQPQGVSIDEAQQISLAVIAQGSNLSYQWRKDGVAVNGAVGSSFVISSSTPSDSGAYDVVVSDGLDSLVSLEALVVVNALVVDNGGENGGEGGGDTGSDSGSGSGSGVIVDPVVIASQPSAVIVDEGQQIQLSVGASGGGSVSYQWRKAGVIIDGATDNTLIINSAVLSDAGVYDVLVTNEAGSVQSSSASVGVNEVIVLQSIALEWSIPEAREDGAALELNEIDGYVISYGVEAGNLENILEVGSGTDTSYIVEDLEPGTYYFAIATVDIDGVQGASSEVISLSL